ncbi:MAG: alpha/beta fold hydrolase, partial [Clostridia bacterium]|nr:alpha/beta fold hydrolase [Clostridia bacterium]
GHGHSLRTVGDPEATHVEHCSDYVDDLDALIKGIVLQRAGSLPLFLFGHSMGGAVVVKYLADHPEVKIAKAILSSPMVCPQTHRFPRRLLLARTKTYAKRFGPTANFPHSRPFNPAPAFESSSDTSWARFREHIRLRCVDIYYRNSTATVRWMLEALPVKDELLKRKTTNGITCPVLIVSCGRDTVVRNGPQRRLARHLKNARVVFLKEAKHTPFTACQPVIGEYYDALFRFLAE